MLLLLLFVFGLPQLENNRNDIDFRIDSQLEETNKKNNVSNKQNQNGRKSILYKGREFEKY